MTPYFLIALAFAQPYVASAQNHVVVPISTHTGLPTLRATVSGMPVTLVLDLGGYKGIALTSAALADLNVRYDSRVEHWRNSEGTVFTSRLFEAPDVRIGEQAVGPVAGIEYSTTTPGVDGYVGFAVLRNFTLVLDYPHNELRLFPSSSTALEAECGLANPIPIEIVSGVVQSKVSTDRGELVFQWDTGATENVLRPTAIDLDPETRVSSHVFSRFVLGGKDYGRTRIPLREFVAPNVDGALGGEFFGSRKVCLDFSRKFAAIH